MKVTRRELFLAVIALAWTRISPASASPIQNSPTLNNATAKIRTNQKQEIYGSDANCVVNGICTAQRRIWDNSNKNWKQQSTPDRWPANYDADFRTGIATITGRIKLIPQDGLKITATLKAHWKSQIEEYWNHKFRLNLVELNSADGGDYRNGNTSGHFPLRIVCQFVESEQHVSVDCHQGAATGPWGSMNSWSANKWWELHGKMGAEVRAYQFGRCIGLYSDCRLREITPIIDLNLYCPDRRRLISNGLNQLKAQFLGEPGNQFAAHWLQSMERITNKKFQVVIS